MVCVCPAVMDWQPVQGTFPDFTYSVLEIGVQEKQQHNWKRLVGGLK